MGNCFSGFKKTNRVCPSDDDEGERDIHEILSEATVFKMPNPGEQADMVRDLQEKGMEPTVGAQGIAFVVDFKENITNPTQGSEEETEGETGEKKDSQKKDVRKKEIEYTDEEEQLMAEILRDALIKERMEKARKAELKMLEIEIMRDAQMNQRKEKARQVDTKISDAAKRRENKLQGFEIDLLDKAATPDICERKRKVKEMADKARRKAAEARKAMEE